MTLDELIAKLQEIREERGGGLPVVTWNPKWREFDPVDLIDVHAADYEEDGELCVELGTA